MPARVASRAANRAPSPSITYREFLHLFHTQWQQGEHVTLIGPTGCGKTELSLRLLPRRDYVTVFSVKPRDRTMDKLIRAGYKQQKRWDGSYHDHIVLWPRGRNAEETQHLQYHEFKRAIDAMERQAGWCMFFDEVSYMTDFLGMQRLMRYLLQLGRSSGISIMAGTQRPAFIPLAFYDQPTHLIFWSDNDHTNLKRIANLGGMDSSVIRKEVSELGEREILYLNTRTKQRVRTVVRLRSTATPTR